MRNVLTYGDISSSDYDIFIGQETIYNVPERAVEVVSVPGRNGALTIDQGHYENVSIEYYCFVEGQTEAEMHAKYNAYKNAIASVVGYQKIVDSYYPNEYRLGLFIEGIEADSVALGTGLEFRLIFNCKPQRYLANGDDEVTVSDGDIVNNPTLYDAEPLLMVEGYGNVGFNGYNINVENATMGELNMWLTGSVTSKNNTISTTETFDRNQFNDGDSFTYDFDARVSVSGPMAKSSNESHTGDGVGSNTASPSMESGTVKNSLTATHVVGTASTVEDTYTVIFTNTSITSTITVNLTLRSEYDGDSTVTISMEVSATPSSSLIYGTRLLNYTSAVGDSSALVLGHPTYIDCEIGEAYKYEGDSLIGLNSYIDLGSDLPKLSKGINTFTIDDTITSLTLVPRWWQL